MVCGVLIAVTSVVVEHGLCCPRLWGIFEDQGPVSLALAAGSLTAGPPGKSPKLFFNGVTCCLECGKGEKGLWKRKVTSFIH